VTALSASESEPLLQVRDLRVSFAAQPGRPAAEAVRGVSFVLRAGETLALVGESGAGKSLTGLALLGLLPPEAAASGEALWRGRNLLALSESQLRRIRGREIGLIMQEPSAAMNPAFPVGAQIAETLRLHRGLKRAAAKSEALALMRQLRLPDPERSFRAFPHELSGGMLQRMTIALAGASRPSLLIADEPTTALDATAQREALRLLVQIQQETGSALLFVTHNLALVAEMADRVLVMRSGEAVESSEVGPFFAGPAHPYSRELLAAAPHRPGLPA
jgi:ABC-type dipeptide/oligopeptide/nickel transport system ATPase component